MGKINIKNVKSFILGNLNYYLNKIIDLPLHLKEQYYYRLYKCKDDCLITGRCILCNCPIQKKAFAPDSCNEDRFPKFLPGQEWEDYKKKNKIDNIDKIIKTVEDEISKRRI